MPEIAFISVDPQIDFCPGGALPVNRGDRIIPILNSIAAKIKDDSGIAVLTQDYHPPGHLSFASAHKDKNPSDPIEGIDGIGPVLWPDHCVIGHPGSDFHPDLDTTLYSAVIRKGLNPKVDSYSGFFDNNKQDSTGLDGYLKSLGVKKVIIGGLAYDFCVKFTAIDSANLGFDTTVVRNACMAIYPDKNHETEKEMTDIGIKVVDNIF